MALAHQQQEPNDSVNSNTGYHAYCVLGTIWLSLLHRPGTFVGLLLHPYFTGEELEVQGASLVRLRQYCSLTVVQDWL
jgi:hypothetical protein